MEKPKEMSAFGNPYEEYKGVEMTFSDWKEELLQKKSFKKTFLEELTARVKNFELVY